MSAPTVTLPAAAVLRALDITARAAADRSPAQQSLVDGIRHQCTQALLGDGATS